MTTDRNIRKTRQMLENMVGFGQLSSQGKDWLIEVTDPFHDAPLTLSGYPDLTINPSLVQLYSYTAPVSAPPNVTGAWDAHIFVTPLTPNLAPTSFALSPYNYVPQTGTVTGPAVNIPSLVPGLNCIVGPAGKDWTAPNAAPNQFSNYSMPGGATQPLTFPVQAVGGQFRVIAVAMEVVNTTAELLKSGSVTTYRVPTVARDLIQLTVAPGAPLPNFIARGCEPIELPPGTQAAAQLYPTSRTWMAAEGSYNIGTQNDLENRYLLAQPNLVGAIPAASADELLTGATSIAWFPGSSIGGWQTGGLDTTIRVTPFDTFGSIFAGLNIASTLQVTIKYIVERVPTSREAAFVNLTRMPTPYDPMAIELYTRALAKLPVAVMVKENPLGEWFNDILEAVSTYAPIVGSAFGAPGIAIGKAFGTGADLWLKERQKTAKKPKKPRAQTSNALPALPPPPPPLATAVNQNRALGQRKTRPRRRQRGARA